MAVHCHTDCLLPPPTSLQACLDLGGGPDTTWWQRIVTLVTLPACCHPLRPSLQAWLDQGGGPDTTLWQRVVGLMSTRLEPSPASSIAILDLQALPLMDEVGEKQGENLGEGETGRRMWAECAEGVTDGVSYAL